MGKNMWFFIIQGIVVSSNQMDSVVSNRYSIGVDRLMLN